MHIKIIYFFLLVTPLGYARGRGHHESSVHRNPYEAHNAYDIIRTQDADLAVSKTHRIQDTQGLVWGYPG